VRLFAALLTKLTISDSVPDLATSADLVDAAVCVLAGADFISGAQWAQKTAPSPSMRAGSGPPRQTLKRIPRSHDACGARRRESHFSLIEGH
jgi:hypothetical protein